MASHASDSGLDPKAICSLPPRDLTDRLAWIRTEILPHAVGSTRLANGLRIELEDAPGLRDTLDRLIALEAECCGTIEYAWKPDASGRLALTVRGIDPDASIFAELGVSTGGRASSEVPDCA